MKAVCFSVATMDYFPQSGEHHAGGNALNQSIHFSTLGYESYFIGAIGTDRAGDSIGDLLHHAGVDISRMKRLDGDTASNRITIDAAGERFGVEGAWKSGVYAGFRLTGQDWDFVNACDVIATHADCPDYQYMLRQVGRNPFVTVDFLHLEDYDLMRKSAGIVDVIFSGGHTGMINDLRQIAEETGMLIVLTLGAGGSMAFFRDKIFSQDALDIARVVDTTGCGDAFQAAFTCEYLRSGDIQASLMAGAYAGKHAAGTIGGSQWL